MIPLYGTSYTTCIGCDTAFNEMLNIKKDCVKQTGRANYTGHNNTRDAESSTSRSRTSQSQSIQQQSISSAAFVRNNNNVGMIGTSGISGRQPQSQHSNVSQPNRSNRPNTDRNTISNNRENHTSWVNSGDFNSSRNRSDQSTSRDSRNANSTITWGNIDNNTEIMCNCHEIAIKLTVRKEGPNKGK